MRIIMLLAFPFIVGVLIAPMLINNLKRMKFGQEVREEGPKSHLKKQGIPTMGGLLFILLLVAYSLAFRLFTFSVIFILASVLLYGAIGFIDDYLKIKRKSSDGLSSKQKLVLQFLVALALSITAKHFGTLTVFPFWKIIDLRVWYVPLILFMNVALTNSVNLTDGLDGLATSVTALVVAFLSGVAFFCKVWDIFEVSLIMLASMLAFLMFNKYPAKVFMGDTGSFALGGFVAATATALGIPLFVPIFGLIYVIESLSVIIQVAHFKRTGRRIFKMSPIHHHFELLGNSEVKIVTMFSIFTLACCLLAFWGWWVAFF